MGTAYGVPKRHSHVDECDINREFKSGDLVLFCGASALVSKLVQFMQDPIPWTHVGFIVRDVETHILYLVQSTFHDAPSDYWNDSDGRVVSEGVPKSGVKITPLVEALREYRGKAIAFRRLLFPIETLVRAEERDLAMQRFELRMWEAFREFYKKHHHKPYEQNMLELARASFSTNSQSGDDSFFCSELVARFYQHVGLLPWNGMLANNYNLKHFTTMSGMRLSLLPPFQLSDEIYLFHDDCST